MSRVQHLSPFSVESWNNLAEIQTSAGFPIITTHDGGVNGRDTIESMIAVPAPAPAPAGSSGLTTPQSSHQRQPFSGPPALNLPDRLPAPLSGSGPPSFVGSPRLSLIPIHFLIIRLHISSILLPTPATHTFRGTSPATSSAHKDPHRLSSSPIAQDTTPDDTTPHHREPSTHRPYTLGNGSIISSRWVFSMEVGCLLRTLSGGFGLTMRRANAAWSIFRRLILLRMCQQ